MDPMWQVAIGTGIAGVLLTLFGLFRSYLKESRDDNESQKLAIASIIFGLSGIILAFVGSLIGLILGVLSIRKKKNKALGKIGIFLSCCSMIPWILVLIFGP